MKKIYIIAAALTLVLTASCNRKVGFEHETFATLDAVSYSVDETVGKLIVPVSIYNPTGAEVQISVSVDDVTATSGTDYDIVSPALGLLTFSGEETTKNIEIDITDFSGEFTGSKSFTIHIASVTEGVTVGSFSTASVKIKDLDHPLAMFIGEWSGSIDSYFDGGNIPITFTIKSNDDDATFSTLIIENLDPSYAAVGGTAANGVNIFTANVNKDKNQLTLAMGQPVGEPGYILVGMDSTHITTATGYQDITMNLTGDTLVIPNGWGTTAADGSGYWIGIYGGPTELTRK